MSIVAGGFGNTSVRVTSRSPPRVGEADRQMLRRPAAQPQAARGGEYEENEQLWPAVPFYG